MSSGSANRTELAPAWNPVRWVRGVSFVASLMPGLFFAVMMVLGFVTPGYDWIARYGSELSLGPLGGVMIASFICLGLVELAFGGALVRTLGNGPSGWTAALAVCLLGAAFVVAGVCVTDPSTLVGRAHTWHGDVHALMAVVIFFISTPIACVAAAVRLRGRPWLAIYCLVTAIATPGALVLTFTSGALLGLVERIAIAILFAWLTTMAVAVHRGAAR